MKNLFLFFALTLFTLTNINAQDSDDSGKSGEGFNAFVSAGLPVGDAADFATFNFTVGFNHLWEVSNGFELGLGAAYSHSFGDDIDVLGTTIELDDASTLLLGGGARLHFGDGFAVGIDLGYGIGLSPDENDGGFFYSPNIRYYISDSANIYFSYGSITDDGDSFDTINLGVEFGL